MVSAKRLLAAWQRPALSGQTRPSRETATCPSRPIALGNRILEAGDQAIVSATELAMLALRAWFINPLSVNTAPSMSGLKRVIEGRIQSLANVHRLFVESRWTGADLRSLVTQELSPYSREGDGQARIEGPQLMVTPDAAQAIAVTLHELATNAAKYGALSVPEGYVQVECGARKGLRAKSPCRRDGRLTTAFAPLLAAWLLPQRAITCARKALTVTSGRKNALGPISQSCNGALDTVKRSSG